MIASIAQSLVPHAGSLCFTQVSGLCSEVDETSVQRTDDKNILGQVKKASRGISMESARSRAAKPGD